MMKLPPLASAIALVSLAIARLKSPIAAVGQRSPTLG